MQICRPALDLPNSGTVRSGPCLHAFRGSRLAWAPPEATEASSLVRSMASKWPGSVGDSLPDETGQVPDARVGRQRARVPPSCGLGIRIFRVG